MLTTATAPTGTLTLRPAEEAYDFAYFRHRLADPAVLADAIAVCVFRAPLLAVPVGGPRRGGYMSFDLLSPAVEARNLLAERPGFPDLRIRWSPCLDICHTVRWGQPAPAWWEDDVVFGRFYGYSEAAIASFVRNQQQRRPRSAVSRLSPM
ncbi:DUF6302 family protein [Streptomyces sp. NPDC088789]|uniref:DUF6302 family protein n=1 Tax=Streptomyces sp. NPDC088789 TaxID=3365899 RepID=UPI0038143300